MARARRGTLSRTAIARAALELIDAEGIGAASMRSVAKAIGVEAMSLYNHVSNRDDLVDAIVDLVVAELDEDEEVLREPQDGWRDYLTRLARGVRRYALAHPHAFPVVATRPASAPWINPPLRSLAWIESMLEALGSAGFDDEEIVFAYRSFNSFLLGYLLMETGARALRAPKEGDGSFAAEGEPSEPVPGGLSPARNDGDAEAIAEASAPLEVLDPLGEVDTERYPAIRRLAAGLAEDRYAEEFERSLAEMLDGIEAHLRA